MTYTKYQLRRSLLQLLKVLELPEGQILKSCFYEKEITRTFPEILKGGGKISGFKLQNEKILVEITHEKII